MAKIRRKWLLGAWVLCLVLVSTRVDADNTAEVVIPFSAWRILLPWDGEIIQFIPKPGEEGYNQWPKNQNKGSFEQHETTELSFGWRIRAQGKHRKYEGPMSTPGFIDHGEFVRINGGFRSHKAVSVLKDYFDGTFSADLYLAVVDGRFTPRIDNLDIDWNGGDSAKVAGLLTFGLLDVVTHGLINKFENEYEGKANSSFSLIRDFYLKARENQEVFARVADRTRLAVRGTSLVFQIDATNLSNPNAVFPPALKARKSAGQEQIPAMSSRSFSEVIDVTADACAPTHLARPTFSAATVDLGERFLIGTGKGLFEVRGIVDASGMLRVESIARGLEIGFGSTEAVLKAIEETRFKASDEGCQVRFVYEVR